MNEHSGTFLFRVWPYLALTVAVVGFGVRLLLTSDQVPAVKRMLPSAKQIYLGKGPWAAAWALLAAAHVAGLLFPRALLALTATPARLVVVELLGLAVGGAVLAACVRTAWVHLRRPSRDGWSLVFDFADSVFMSFLFVGVASGLLAAAFYRWGSAWGAATLAPYTASLLHGQPAPAFVEHLPFVVRLHLFTAFAALAAFPATRLAAFPLVLAHRAVAATGRALGAAARPAGAWLRGRSTSWLWPEREIRWLVKPATVDGGRSKLPGAAAPVWQLANDGAAVVKQPRGKAV